MPHIVPVSRDRHGALQWRSPAGYSFAAGDAVAPLVVQELPKAAMTLPIGFVPDNGQFVPVAVQGLQSGKNLLVAPDGRWLGGYVPALYRGFPFALALTETGQQVLCVNEDSGLVGTTGEQPFFKEDGQPSQALANVLGFLTQVSANRLLTQRMCAVLQKHQLIQPWVIQVQTDNGPQSVDGLFRVDETALNQLPAQVFEEVRQSGALPMAYCQLLSMQHLPKLGELARAHAQAAQAVAASAAAQLSHHGELNLDFLNQDGVISLGGA